MSYKRFTDTSVSNSNISTDIPKMENITRAKMNIDEIKKSERRLQEMLNVPVSENKREINNTHTNEIPTETIVDISKIDKNTPIIIQSIDKLKDADIQSDDDEYGEVKPSPNSRKSIVTFNENVEKIIHVEDHHDDLESVPDYEVDKL